MNKDINCQNKDSILVVRNLKKSFGTKEVLNDLSFDLFEGETLALLGSNGAGKSLTIDIISGIQAQDDGEVYLNLGKEDWIESVKEIGIQFQESKISGGVKVGKIIKKHKLLYKNRLLDDETYNEMHDVFEIEKINKQKLSSLSGGQKQRLNLFIALMHNPKIIILDEFTTGLDVNLSDKILNFIYKLKKQNNSSMIIISHHPKEVEELADRVILLKDGIIEENLTINEILNSYPNIEAYMKEKI